MMTENEARNSLEELVKKYMPYHPNKDKLINIIRDASRPGLPIRGVLEDMRTYRTEEYSIADKDLIDELIYLYG